MKHTRISTFNRKEYLLVGNTGKTLLSGMTLVISDLPTDQCFGLLEKKLPGSQHESVL